LEVLLHSGKCVAPDVTRLLTFFANGFVLLQVRVGNRAVDTREGSELS